MSDWNVSIALARAHGLTVELARIPGSLPKLGHLAIDDTIATSSVGSFVESMLSSYDGKLLLPDNPVDVKKIPAGVTDEPLSLLPILITPAETWDEGVEKIVKDMLVPLHVRSEVRRLDDGGASRKAFRSGTQLEFAFSGKQPFWHDHIIEVIALEP